MSTIGNGSQNWGLRSQLGATIKLLDDLETGNRDGITGNEDRAPQSVQNAFERNPLAQRTRDFASVGLSTRDEIARLDAFVQKVEDQWGQPTIAPDVAAKMNGGALYAAQKAIRLARIGRTPADVVDGFVAAKGSVDGQAIPPRDIHIQTHAPIGTPSGHTVVISPGYLETGRTFDEQVHKLNQQGHKVVVMDHQWAGQSDGKPGGIDRGFGVARDVAAVTAFAAKEARADFGDDAKVVLFGNSMGAGPGAFGAALMNDAGKIALEGDQMPKGIDLVLQAPFFGATKSVLNMMLQGGAQIPMVNRLQLPGTGLPNITNDPRAEQLGAQDMVMEDIRSQLSAFATAQPDLDAMMDLVQSGQVPSGNVHVVGNRNDTLANAEKWFEVETALANAGAGDVVLDISEGTDHVLSQSLGEQDRALDAIAKLLA